MAIAGLNGNDAPLAPEVFARRLENRGGRGVTLGELASRRGAITLTCYPPARELAEARRAAFAGSERPH